jgi:hypothetical protein
VKGTSLSPIAGSLTVLRSFFEPGEAVQESQEELAIELRRIRRRPDVTPAGKVQNSLISPRDRPRSVRKSSMSIFPGHFIGRRLLI